MLFSGCFRVSDSFLVDRVLGVWLRVMRICSR